MDLTGEHHEHQHSAVRGLPSPADSTQPTATGAVRGARRGALPDQRACTGHLRNRALVIQKLRRKGDAVHPTRPGHLGALGGATKRADESGLDAPLDVIHGVVHGGSAGQSISVALNGLRQGHGRGDNALSKHIERSRLHHGDDQLGIIFGVTLTKALIQSRGTCLYGVDGRLIGLLGGVVIEVGGHGGVSVVKDRIVGAAA